MHCNGARGHVFVAYLSARLMIVAGLKSVFFSRHFSRVLRGKTPVNKRYSLVSFFKCTI